MKFAILVNSGPLNYQSAYSALIFAQSAIKLEHSLFRVFFYLDGVYNANRFIAALNNENNLVQVWSKLAKDNKVDLVICITAGLRRGIRGINLASGFRISGLGELVEASVYADRLITFGS
ncbi:MAG: sulfurtransferase complex subunit TusD [Rhodospirillaceae bacterium]|nr:sulfurtransferase complex subunit TusD [Rhodospirillaceae bacterium]